MSGRLAVFSSLLMLLMASAGLARPPHKKAMADHFGPFLAQKLNDCRTCHVPDQPGGAANSLSLDEKPHNLFGARVKAVRSELKKAARKTGIPERLEAVAEEDADGDGASNVMELLTGHFPGDANDQPSDVELAQAKKTLVAFNRHKSAYPWTPFELVKRPALPTVVNSAWIKNPIDAFIAAEHEARGLKPRPQAPKQTLLRRVYLDLIGLPPTPDELHAFLADNSSGAYEQVVDRLLNDPRYGERWGRHWMDIWRYSDWAGWTDGGQIRDSQPHIWRWRDWIIESLNQDKGYDQQIIEMLAADELYPEDMSALRATGYLVRNYKMLSREKWMQDTVEHTFLAFQGVTIGCAKCHDHMFDPILQKEYYRLRAIFEPHQVRIDRIPGELDTKKDGLPRAYDADIDVKTFLFKRGDDRDPDKSNPMPPGVPELLGGAFPEIKPVQLPVGAHAPDRRDFVIQMTVKSAEEDLARKREALKTAQAQTTAVLDGLIVGAVKAKHQPAASASKELDKPLDAVQKQLAALALAEIGLSLAEAKHASLLAVLRVEGFEDTGKEGSDEWKKGATEAANLQRKEAVLEARWNLLVAQQNERTAPEKGRAEAMSKRAEAEKALAKAEADAKQPPSTAYTKRPNTYAKVSSGRRLAFARWLASKDNPLTARVAMNHIWLRHFGQAIVPSVFDFGRNGRPPSHPALLDWLAAELMERGWSMKAMHRLIVTSNTYRMASTTDSANVAMDRDNIYLWRMPSRRLEAELVRDCALYVAGQLDPTMGGPDIDYNEGLKVPRRSLYFRHAAEKQMEFLKLFDAASVTECYQRKESVLPQQALALANSELTVKNARRLARQLSKDIGSDASSFIAAAFEHVLSRSPTREELLECVNFMNQQTAAHSTDASKPPNEPDVSQPAADPALRARENLVHVLMNHHDFVTIR